MVLSGHGVTGGQFGTFEGRTATWDEWGIFLAALYRRDPEMRCKRYDCAEHFEWATGGRYEWLEPADQCLRHRWDREYVPDRGYTEDQCRCGARRRSVWAHLGYTWHDFAGGEIYGLDTTDCSSSDTVVMPPAAKPWSPRRKVNA